MSIEEAEISFDYKLPILVSTINTLDIETSIKLRFENIDNPYICHLNINSLRNKRHDIRFLVSKITPEIFTISETKLDSTFSDAQFMIEGYQNPGEFRRDRNKHGGVY